VVKPVFHSDFFIMGFKPAILKKLEKNLAAIFPIRSQKKWVKPAKAVLRTEKNSSP
jgi:hypothetical protein